MKHAPAIATLAAAGLRDREIAEALDLSPSTVQAIRARVGIPAAYPPGRPRTAEHGTASRYRYGCRCTQCVEAMREAARARHARERGIEVDRVRTWRRWSPEEDDGVLATDNLRAYAHSIGRTYVAAVRRRGVLRARRDT